MKIFEIGTGYTSIPAKMGAATEIVVEELAKSFLKNGKDVTIVDIRDKFRKPTNLPVIEVYMPQMMSTGAVVKLGIVHKIKRVLYSISLTYKLHHLIKKEKEKIFLHFHNQYNLYFFLKLTSQELRDRCVIGYTVHSYIWFGKWEDIKDKVKVSNFQEIYCCQHADKVFVLNDIVADMLIQHCNVPRSSLIHVINGVNIDVYNENNASKAAIENIKRRFHIEGKKIVFQVGSVCERKNQLGTLKLLSSIMHTNENIAYAYAGGIIDADYQNQIEEYANSEGFSDRVVYLGEVSPGEQLNNLYSMAYICFMNSTSEAFALVIAEALSIPRPIFINDNIMRSLVFWGKKEGEGIIRISDQFNDELNKLLTDETYYKEISSKGRIFIEKEFSWDVAASLYLSAL